MLIFSSHRAFTYLIIFGQPAGILGFVISFAITGNVGGLLTIIGTGMGIMIGYMASFIFLKLRYKHLNRALLRQSKHLPPTRNASDESENVRSEVRQKKINKRQFLQALGLSAAGLTGICTTGCKSMLGLETSQENLALSIATELQKLRTIQIHKPEDLDRARNIMENLASYLNLSENRKEFVQPVVEVLLSLLEKMSIAANERYQEWKKRGAKSINDPLIKEVIAFGTKFEYFIRVFRAASDTTITNIIEKLWNPNANPVQRYFLVIVLGEFTEVDQRVNDIYEYWNYPLLVKLRKALLGLTQQYEKKKQPDVIEYMILDEAKKIFPLSLVIFQRLDKTACQF